MAEWQCTALEKPREQSLVGSTPTPSAYDIAKNKETTKLRSKELMPEFEQCVFRVLIKNPNAKCQDRVCPQFPVARTYKFSNSSNGQESEREWLTRLIKFHGLTLDDCDAFRKTAK